MVKHLQQADSCISSRKRVSFKTDCKSEDYSSTYEDGLPTDVSDVLNGDGIERFLKVMQSINVARMDSVERFAEISKMMNTERNENLIFGGPKRKVSDVNLHKHQNECIETSRPTRIAKNTNIRQNDVIRVDIAKEISLRANRIDSCKQLGLSPVASPSQSAVDGVNCLGETTIKPSVLRVNSVEGLTDDDAQSSRESTPTGSGNSSRRGSGDSLQEPNRGYSSQRRHGRKDSLGTVDFTRLIPTLVSDNEDFRHKEYQRKLSVQPIELQQSTW